MTTVAASAVVEEGAQVGVDCTVWDLSQIRTGAVLGAECTIGRNVFVDAGVVLGARCKIQNNALLYAPARLGDGVFIGPGVILTNDRLPRAVSPTGYLLGAADWMGEGVTVDDGAAIGARSVVVAGVHVGAWALVGAGSVVVADVPAYALVVGNPARRIGWVGRTGARLDPADPGTLRCPVTGSRFVDRGDCIEEIT
ncbi:MAG: DapH/DapD/GlmU-related protein [Acidimicrobiales bacterium]